MKRYFDTVLNRAGVVVSGATVTVYDDATYISSPTEAQLYSDNGVSTIDNPVETDENGLFSFYVADGTYTLAHAYEGEEVVIRGVEIFDDSDDRALTARSLRVPSNESGITIPASAARSLKFLGFDGSGAATALDAADGAFSQDAVFANATQGAKLQQVISVFDAPYNAVGDNSANDTAALVAAIAEAKARKCWLDFGAGTFAVDQITLTSDHYWRGNGATLRARDGLNQDVLRGFDVENMVIEDMIIDGDKPATSSRVDVNGQGIHLLKGTNIVMRNVQAINCLENGLRLVGINSFALEDITIDNCGHNGFYGSGYSDGSAWLEFGEIRNLSVSNCATDGFAFEFGCRNINVFGVRSFNNGNDQSLYVGGAGCIIIGYDATKYPDNIHVYGLKTSGNYGGGLYVLGTKNVSVSGYDSLNDGLDSPVGEATFGMGVALYATDDDYVPNENFRLSDAVIQGCGKHGVWFDDNLTTAGGRNETAILTNVVVINAGQKQAGSYDGFNIQFTDNLLMQGCCAYDFQGVPTMRRPATIASTCLNPRIIEPTFQNGLSGAALVSSATATTVMQNYADGKMLVSYGALTAEAGAAFETVRSGTGNVDLKVRNSNVAFVGFVDSAFGYVGTTSAHNFNLIRNSVTIATLNGTSGATGCGVSLSLAAASTTYANDAAAAVGGVPVGGLYRNGSVLQVRIS